MTIDGEPTPFQYNANDNTIVIILEYNPELDVTEIVLHKE